MTMIVMTKEANILIYLTCFALKENGIYDCLDYIK